MSENSKDCLSCRLVSGGGFMFGALYVLHQAKRLKSYSLYAVTGIAYCMGGIGLLRIFNVNPFRYFKNAENKPDIEKLEENDYIVGKLPPKFNQ